MSTTTKRATSQDYHAAFFPCRKGDAGAGCDHVIYKLADGSIEIPCAQNPQGNDTCDEGRYRNIDRLEIKAGYVVKVFKGREDENNRSYRFYHATQDNLDPEWHEQIGGAYVLKDCKNDNFIWDDDCGTKNARKAFGSCDEGTECEQKRLKICNDESILSSTDATLKTKCIAQCTKDLGKCMDAILPFCKKNPANTLCTKPEVAEVLSNNCVSDAANLSTQTCQEFCLKSEENTQACKNVIQTYCTADKFASNNAFCKKAATRREMWGDLNTAMDAFCKTEAGLTSGLCECYRTKEIDALASGITDTSLQTLIKQRPECFYGRCAKSTTTYKRTSDIDVCPAFPICSRDIPSGLEVSDDDALDNNDSRCRNQSPAAKSAAEQARKMSNKMMQEFLKDINKPSSPRVTPPASKPISNTTLAAFVSSLCMSMCCCLFVIIAAFVMMKK